MSPESTVTIFWFSGSPYSWRVLLAMAVKQAPFESRRLEASREEHRSPEFLAVNPRGKVPALRDGEHVMGESVAILRYIDQRFPEPPLFGSEPIVAARINQQIDEIENYLVPNTHGLTRSVFGDMVAGREDVLKEQASRARTELSGYESRMGNWLVGETLSAADISLYPVIAALLRAAGKPVAESLELQLLPFDRHYPSLAAWCARVEALPGFDASYPPHWRESN